MPPWTKIHCMIHGLHNRIQGFIVTHEDMEAYKRIMRDRKAMLLNHNGVPAMYEYDGTGLREVKNG